MSEEVTLTTFDLTCSDGTIFTLPSNHPEINVGGIGGVSYNAILADPSQIPPQFEQYCTFRPPPAPKPSFFMRFRIMLADRLNDWLRSKLT